MCKLLKDFWPGIAWGIIVFVLSAVPGNYFPQIQTFANWLSPDKIAHVGLYFMFSILFFRGVRSYRGYLNSKHLFLGTVLVVFFGGLMELGQHYLFIGRNGNIYDFLANLLGCIMAYVLILYIESRKKKIEEKIK